MGVVDAIAALFTKLGGGNVFLIYTIIVWASVLIRTNSCSQGNTPMWVHISPKMSTAAIVWASNSLLVWRLLNGCVGT